MGPFIKDEGKCCGHWWVARDITEQKRIEKRI